MLILPNARLAFTLEASLIAGLEARLASDTWVGLIQPVKQMLQEQPEVSTGKGSKVTWLQLQLQTLQPAFLISDLLATPTVSQANFLK